MSTYTVSLSDDRATLEVVGGKGMSLAKLSRAGLPVPNGFHITTEAYRRFVAANGLQPRILAAHSAADLDSPAALDRLSASIAQLFSEAKVPDDLAAAVTAAYAELAAGRSATSRMLAVAVRSSATAEDLPEASFAGQQETYLNVSGAEPVLEAVKKCWASLWTPRAMAYRARQGIAPDLVALAVVVQELVCADASGVMFTANPVTGSRRELVINAAWGLGEAIVGGLVSPDSLTLNKDTGKVIHKQITEKQVMVVRTESGVSQTPVPGSRRKKAVLSDAQSRELAGLGTAIERLYGGPMDIEWALAGGKFAIVQARPVTALPDEAAGLDQAALEWPLPHPKAVLARGSFAEFVPEPVSPLFATLAVPIAHRATVKLMGSIGVTGEGSYIFAVINDYVYVGFVFTPRMAWQMTIATFAMTGSIAKTARERLIAERAAFSEVIERWQSRDVRTLAPSELLSGAREIFGSTASFYTMAQSSPIPAATITEVTFAKFYDWLVKRKGEPDASKFLFGGESHALRSEKALFDIATWAREDPVLAAYLEAAPAEAICAAIDSDQAQVPAMTEFADRFHDYLGKYGHAIYDLDFAKPVPAEAPAALIETLKVYLTGRNNPYERQRAALEFRQQATESTARRLDPLRRKYFLKTLKSAQDIAPLREDSIADVGLGHPQIRRMLGELGRRLAAGGAIPCADDVYWLELQETEMLAARLEKDEALPSLAKEVECRRARWDAMRHITPPTTLPRISWMARFFPSNESSGPTIKGFGASAGKVTARACVMLGPEDFGRMQPGDVIVAGITTPAWTPLFARAAAIVTDIGGPLSHSSIVAREYGIPAVLATGVGTRRIKDGQTITVDGTAGTVTLSPV